MLSAVFKTVKNGCEYIMNNDDEKLLLLPQKCTSIIVKGNYCSPKGRVCPKRGLQFNNFISVKSKNLQSLTDLSISNAPCRTGLLTSVTLANYFTGTVGAWYLLTFHLFLLYFVNFYSYLLKLVCLSIKI